MSNFQRVSGGSASYRLRLGIAVAVLLLVSGCTARRTSKAVSADEGQRTVPPLMAAIPCRPCEASDEKERRRSEPEWWQIQYVIISPSERLRGEHK